MIVTNMNRCQVLASIPNAQRILIRLIELYEVWEKGKKEKNSLMIENLDYETIASDLFIRSHSVARSISALCDYQLLAKIPQIKKGVKMPNSYLFTSELIKRYWVDYNTFCKLNDQPVKQVKAIKLTKEMFNELKIKAKKQLAIYLIDEQEHQLIDEQEQAQAMPKEQAQAMPKEQAQAQAQAMPKEKKQEKRKAKTQTILKEKEQIHQEQAWQQEQEWQEQIRQEQARQERTRQQEQAWQEQIKQEQAREQARQEQAQTQIISKESTERSIGTRSGIIDWSNFNQRSKQSDENKREHIQPIIENRPNKAEKFKAMLQKEIYKTHIKEVKINPIKAIDQNNIEVIDIILFLNSLNEHELKECFDVWTYEFERTFQIIYEKKRSK